MGLEESIRIALEKLSKHEHLCLYNLEMWWTDEDLHAVEYLKSDNAEQLQSILPYLRGNDVAVQAGAHCGYTIMQLEPHFNRIYCFEPDPTMFLALCLNLPSPNIYKFQGCLGDTHRLVSMQDNEEFPYSGARFVSGVGHIPMLTIDDLALDACDLIMLDIEGLEFLALWGAKRTIDKFHPLLCIEVAWCRRSLAIDKEEIEAWLADRGYREVARAGESDRIYQYHA